jgi:hypothetical protein
MTVNQEGQTERTIMSLVTKILDAEARNLVLSDTKTMLIREVTGHAQTDQTNWIEWREVRGWRE